jgi:hypothetical protein
VSEHPNDNDWTPIGAHRIRIEQDVVFTRFSGKVTSIEGHELLVLLQRVLQQQGRLYLLFDNSQNVGLDPEARRLFIRWLRENPIAGIANFGGGVVPRTLAFLLINAIRLVVKEAPAQTYVSTEAEARAWLDALRKNPPP